MISIPFKYNGDQYPHTPSRHDIERYSIKSYTNEDFEDTLKFVEFLQVKDIIMVKLKSMTDEGLKYMLLGDFAYLINKEFLKGDVIQGIFRYKKTQNYYSIYFKKGGK